MPRDYDVDDSTPRKRRRTERHSNGSDAIADLRHTMYSFAPSPHVSQPLRPARGGLSHQLGAKKLVVKNLKQHAQWDHKAYADKAWKQLDSALTEIFAGTTSINKEELYKLVENVCRQGEASKLYNQLDNRCRLHINEVLQAIDVDQEEVHLLKAVLQAWQSWKGHMHTIHSIFYFLDRSYLLSSSKLNIADMTPKFFRDVILDLQAKVVNGACQLVSVARGLQSTSATQESVLKDAVDMFVLLSIYPAFESRFLETSHDFAHQWSESPRDSVLQYVQAAQDLISQEMQRCDEYNLFASTRRELLALLENDLVVAKQSYLIDEQAVAALLESKDITHLTALYDLLHCRRLGDSLRPAFEKWANATGTSTVLADSSDDMVIRLLSLQQYLDTVWKSAFQSNETIGHGLRECFESFMNKTKKGDATWGTDNTKVGEMIAKYVDGLLRGGAKAIPDLIRRESLPEAPGEDDEDIDEDTEISKQLDQVLDLFRFVHGKAVFEAFYKKDLAKRLLMGRSASADAERSMLTRLRTECGSRFTENLEQMFKDIELGREEVLAYKQRIEERVGYEKGPTVDLNVNILSAAAWPTYPDVPVVVPANIKKALDDFELHYKTKHTNRKIDWKHALAHCQIRANFPKGTKELVVSSFQAVVLLLFNTDTELSFSHILSETGLPEAEVKRTLQSLACAKLQPLTKHPRGREINETDTFTINADFTHSRFRIKINQVQLKETKEENKETHMRVAEDRNFECQAAVVRIMKSRKTIGHSELISEVIKATMSRGVLAVGDIKKNIDRLIEKDYMEREDGGYSYVA